MPSEHVKRVFHISPDLVPAHVVLAGVAGDAQYGVAQFKLQILRRTILHLVLDLVKPLVLFAVAGFRGFNIIPTNVGSGPAQAR